MPLPKAQRRKHQHKRLINSDAYLRDDGMWDIEARMTDFKTNTIDDDDHGYVSAGEPFHDILLRITIDSSFKVHAVHASIEAAPFEICPNIGENYNQLVGTRIAPGWRAKIRELVGGANGCTHINELFPVVATTAFQSLWPHRDRSALKQGYEKMLDSCHAWSRDGELARNMFPEMVPGPQE